MSLEMQIEPIVLPPININVFLKSKAKFNIFLNFTFASYRNQVIIIHQKIDSKGSIFCII